jgi:flagellar assembly factor FliW
MPVSKTTAPAEITFPDGLVGLPHLVHHSFAAVPDSTLFELVCSDDPAMGFIVAPADDVKAGSTEVLKGLGLIEDGEWVLAILAVHGEPPAITANLAGPIVIDTTRATGRQLVLEDPEFPLQVPVSEGV